MLALQWANISAAAQICLPDGEGKNHPEGALHQSRITGC